MTKESQWSLLVCQSKVILLKAITQTRPCINVAPSIVEINTALYNIILFVVLTSAKFHKMKIDLTWSSFPCNCARYLLIC